MLFYTLLNVFERQILYFYRDQTKIQCLIFANSYEVKCINQSVNMLKILHQSSNAISEIALGK